MKTHLVSYDAPAKFPADVKALCGADIPNAKPVLEFELESGSLHAKQSLVLCRVCTVLALTPVDQRTWIYGVLPQQFADQLNSDATGFYE